MKIIGDNCSSCRNTTDIGEELVWLPIEQIEQFEIKPVFIKERIKEIIGGNRIFHIIEDRDM